MKALTIQSNVEDSYAGLGVTFAASTVGAVLEMLMLLEATAAPSSVPSLGVASQYIASPLSN